MSSLCGRRGRVAATAGARLIFLIQRKERDLHKIRHVREVDLAGKVERTVQVIANVFDAGTLDGPAIVRARASLRNCCH